MNNAALNVVLSVSAIFGNQFVHTVAPPVHIWSFSSKHRWKFFRNIVDENWMSLQTILMQLNVMSHRWSENCSIKPNLRNFSNWYTISWSKPQVHIPVQCHSQGHSWFNTSRFHESSVSGSHKQHRAKFCVVHICQFSGTVECTYLVLIWSESFYQCSCPHEKINTSSVQSGGGNNP